MTLDGEVPLRILIVGTTYAPAVNGQAVFTANLAEGLAALGHDVTAAVPSERWRGYRKLRNGVDLQALAAAPVGNLPDAHFTPFPLPGLRRAFEEFDPQLVHLQDHYPLSRWAYGLARRRDLPVLGTNHFIPENVVHYIMPLEWGRKPTIDALWWTMRSLYDRLDIVTTPTQTAAEILRTAGLKTSVRPISCGVDLDEFTPKNDLDFAAIRRRFGLDPEMPLFIYVGRVDEEKDLEIALHAARQVGDSLQIAVVGEGRYEQEIQTKARQVRTDGRVRFTGFVPDEDLTKLVDSADVFLMPSPAELQSIATLEAMALEKPVLAARARALPELVNEGQNGYLFEPGDPGDAADKMRRMLDERERWPEMGRASRRLAEQHHIENTLRAYESLYREMLAESVEAGAEH